jgi:hypothetical protein
MSGSMVVRVAASAEKDVGGVGRSVRSADGGSADASVVSGDRRSAWRSVRRGLGAVVLARCLAYCGVYTSRAEGCWVSLLLMASKVFMRAWCFVGPYFLLGGEIYRCWTCGVAASTERG